MKSPSIMAGRFGEIVEIMDSNLFVNALKFKVGERYIFVMESINVGDNINSTVSDSKFPFVKNFFISSHIVLPITKVQLFS